MSAHSAPIVFLGPTLTLTRARTILEARYRPPIRRGDLATISGPALIGIVDGMLEDGCRVEPDEVVAAAKKGLQIYGAGSTGALLAAAGKERDIQGIGHVFAFLCRHPGFESLIEMLYTEPDYTTFTVPLINIVLAVEQRYPDRALALADRLCRIPLHLRSRGNIEKVLANNGIPDHEGILAADFKSGDTMTLLRSFQFLQR